QEEPELGGEFMELTIFFSDIADFTPINESMHPMDMARRLGSYLAALTDEIESRQGTVVQYVGDEIMALWGAPQSVQDHATLACHAALACAARVESLWEESDALPSFRTRFGIHTADVAVGHFGSTERLYYGAIGDGINATSRLEGLNKFYGTSILISESTRQLVDDAFHARRIDKVAVKGKSLPITVYELLGTADDPTIDMTWVNRWETAYSCYLKREFSDAKTQFEMLLEQRPGDTAARLFIDRCQRFAQKAPPPDWDGVHQMNTK
ncbi:MAG: adenylate/guanylate cyclase domain-containing protein, partial [Myxococcota bacterium]|nr:adenylate/guanylate cyclase domain-containing protein [Myxococcota bacterium]